MERRELKKIFIIGIDVLKNEIKFKQVEYLYFLFGNNLMIIIQDVVGGLEKLKIKLDYINV